MPDQAAYFGITFNITTYYGLFPSSAAYVTLDNLDLDTSILVSEGDAPLSWITVYTATQQAFYNLLLKIALSNTSESTSIFLHLLSTIL